MLVFSSTVRAEHNLLPDKKTDSDQIYQSLKITAAVTQTGTDVTAAQTGVKMKLKCQIYILKACYSEMMWKV